MDSKKQWNNCIGNCRKASIKSKFDCISMDSATTVSSFRLWKCFTTRNSNVNKWTKKRRVQWAMAHKDDDWSRTVFSYETSYQLFRNTIRRWSKYAQEEKKRIPKNKQKIMVWSAFSIKGQLSCYSFRTTMDGPFDIEIFRKHLLAGARKQFGNRWRYQQDNDPKHTSKVAKQFLETEVPETIDWPSNSPDINPMENIWSILKRRVEKRKASNIHELDQFLHEEWKKFEKTFINNLVRSMRSRCLAIIESKGERINYWFF